MGNAIATITLVVQEYDEAIAWFSRCLGFELVEDAPQAAKRWVVMRPPGGKGASLLLARADGAKQEAAIGRQAGGRVFLFLETDDFDREHERMTREGVCFAEAPRTEPYGKVAVFEDFCGNRWDLLEPKSK